ncbi:response regulator transcription factor [Patescibacteria group bacterium]|nr:response regulator transcription factor [Patescibacteria group bacterium]MBU1754821.1 response regulator transcription factor [Patescibacteria group bacterium]
MRALVVDDEGSVRDLLTQNLRSKCFAVDTAKDGAEGSYMARTNEYDIIILDNMMPEKNGATVCAEIRATGRTVPILVLSVLSDTSRKIELLNAGADDYMTKPFSFEELMARIRALLRRPSKLEGDILTLDDLELDTKTQTLKRSGVDIYLTRKEFMLLEYLMRNQGAVLSRGMIMEHVWDMDSDPFSNTIESHILSLRKKLHLEGTPKLIQTVPGRGYKIDG